MQHSPIFRAKKQIMRVRFGRFATILRNDVSCASPCAACGGEAVVLAIAIIIGILIGAASCLPFRYAAIRVRTVNPTHTGSLAGLFFAAIAVSFVVLGAGIVVCGLVARDVLLAYALAEVVSFIVAVIAFGLISKRQ